MHFFCTPSISKSIGPQIGDLLQELMLQEIILMDLQKIPGVKRNQFMIIVQEDQTANLLLFILKILAWELMLIGKILLIIGVCLKLNSKILFPTYLNDVLIKEVSWVKTISKELKVFIQFN